MIMIGALVCTNHYSFAQCKAKQIMKSCRPNITKPYKYDSYVVNNFTFGDKPQTAEVQFCAFQGQKYQIVFCTSGFEEPLAVNIYDKSMRVKNGRRKIYDSSQGIDNNFWMFQPEKSGNYYIQYDVPVSNTPGVTKQGCVIMLIGYMESAPAPENH